MTQAPSTLPPTELSETAIVTILTERIKQGYYPPGCRLPAERSLAVELGVSRRFARLAYDQLTATGIIERKDFQRPVVPISEAYVFKKASVEPRVSTRSIAAVLPSHPVCSGGLAIVAGINRVLNCPDGEHRVSLFDNSFQTTRAAMLQLERGALASVRANSSVEGLIWWCAGDDDVVADFRRSRPDISIVFIDRVPGGAPVDFVGVDDVESARMAVAHLVDLGHRRVAHVMDVGDCSTIVGRAQGYRTAMERSAGGFDPELLVQIDWAAGAIDTAVDRLLSLPDPPTAIFATNDFNAYEVVEAVEARGLSVPGDISVVGHGDLDQFAPRKFLSTVHQPFELIGRTAAQLLARRLSHPAQPVASTQHMILPSPLIVRRSSGPPR